MSQDSEYSEDLSGGWIQWFCNLEDHYFFCEVEADFFKDPLNLFGIKQKLVNFDKALAMTLRPFPPQDQELQDQQFLQIYPQATDLYGIVHSRFILTSKGLHLMREKFLQGKFGTCPKVYCEKQNVLPIGTSQDIKTARVKVYCPRCQEIYHPKKKSVDMDGAFFGKSFPHILLKQFPDICPVRPTQKYVPTIFGFKLGKNKAIIQNQTKNKDKKK